MDTHQLSNAYRNRVTLSFYYAMNILVFIAIGRFAVRGEWISVLTTTLVLVLMFLPALVKRRFQIYLPFSLRLGITFFIFATLFLGEIGNLYRTVPLWDKFLHFQSGLLLGVSGFVLIYLLNEDKKFNLGLSPGFVAVFAVTFSLAIGVVWEIIEFAGDAYFGSHWQDSNADTMWDLIADGSGALLVSIASYFWMRRHKRLPFTPWRLSIFRKHPKELK